MSAQSFFYQTPHLNYGFYCDDEFDSDCILDELKELCGAIEKPNSIFRVVAQASSCGTGFQIFLAPHLRYSEFADKIIERYKFGLSGLYIKDKKGKNKKIRNAEAEEKMSDLYFKYKNFDEMLRKKTIELLKSCFEKEVNGIEKKLLKIVKKYNMSKVCYEEYYRGLASTWLESNLKKAV